MDAHQPQEDEMKTIRLTNDFHSTSMVIRPRPDGTISERTRKLAKRTLCLDGCTCSDEWGRRGPQPDPNRGIETVHNNSGAEYLTGRVVVL